MLLWTPTDQQRGFALPAAVFALVVLGVLVTGGFFVARQEHRVGISGEQSARALYMTERGIADVVGGTPLTVLTSLPLWGDTVVSHSMDDGSVDVRVTRTGTRTFLLDGTGTVTRGGSVLGGATRRVGVLTRLFTADLNPPAALTTIGDLRVGGSSEIIGHDEIPFGWDAQCDPADMEDKPGVLIDDVDNINPQGNAHTIDGDPPEAEDVDMTSEELLVFGDLTWDDLVAMSNKVVSPGTINGTAPDSILINGSYRCNPIESNWGDPLNPGAVCGSYFPIIYAPGNLKLNSDASGQGILLVEGDLVLTGGYSFYGPVFVKGMFTTTGTGGHVIGGAIAANADLDTSKVTGNALVQYSSCTVERAVLNNPGLSRVKPFAQRGWVDLSHASGS